MPSPAASLHVRLFALIGAQRHGSEARRAAFICWMCAPVYLLFSFWALGGWFLSVGDPALDGRVLSWTTLYGFMSTFAWVALGAHGLHLDHLRRPDRRYTSTILALYAATTALTCYLVGTLNIVAGLAMMGAPLIGILLFPLGRILLVLALASVAILAASIGSALGVVPYAPVLNAGLATATSPGLYYAMSGVVASALYVAYEVLIMHALVTAPAPRATGPQQPAISDPLTGLANRAFILEELAAHLATKNARLGVIRVGIDDLRRINDSHGYAAGDRALVAVAHALRACLRVTDRIGRVDGAGFLIVLPEASASVTQEIAGRCRQAIASAMVMAGERRIPLHASIGVAAGEAREFEGLDALLTRIESALAQARRLAEMRT